MEKITMKHLLCIIFEDNDNSAKLLHELSYKGFNATVIASTSLNHVLHSESADTPIFITLNMLTKNRAFEENTTIFCVLDEDKLEEAKEIVRKVTENFTSIHGGMFTMPLESYEGSF